MLVNSCYVSRAMGARKKSFKRPTFNAITGLIGHIRFRIIQTCLYLAPIPRYYHLSVVISQNLERSLDSEHIPFAGKLSFMHL